MEQKINITTHVTTNPNRYPMIYYPIDDDDCESANFYENNGYTVRTITLNGIPHHFALIPTETQELADRINREFSYLRQQEQHSLQQKMDSEASYDQAVEVGYRFAVDNSDPADVFLNLATVKALLCELNNLPEQQRHICQMISAGMVECEMATELGISRKALQGRKLELLKKLKMILKKYY